MDAQSPLPIACDLGALDPLERQQRAELAKRILGRKTSAQETVDGYAIVIRGPSTMSTEIVEWFLLEKRCCPFLRFSLTLEPGAEDVRIDLAGGPGVKEFLAASGLGRATRP